MLTTIIFSKNRACQLELLLRSLSIRATVLYTYDPKFKTGYDKLISIYPRVKFVKETNFQAQLIELIQQGAPYTLFLVDDDVMIRGFTAECPEFDQFKHKSKIICLSLRLSPDYHFRGLPQIIDGKMAWQPFARGSKTFNYRLRDWGCPMAIGAHLFRRKDILPTIKRAKEIKTPNFLEIILSANPPNRPLMMCFDKSKFVNVEANQVQTDFHSHPSGPSPESLEKKFLDNWRLSLSDIIQKANYTRSYFLNSTEYVWEKTP